jgi:uncharacterized membrane protein
MITSRSFMKLMLVALTVGAVVTFTVSLTAGLVLGTAVAVGSISLLPVVPAEVKALDRDRRTSAAGDQQRATEVYPDQPGTPPSGRIIVTIARPGQSPLRNAMEQAVDDRQSPRRRR